MAQALFANQRESNLHSTIALVEDVLGELGHPAAGSRIKDAGSLHAWQLVKGSAITQVTLVDRTEFTHLRVCSIVMTLDDRVDRSSLVTHLLELNAGLCGAACAVVRDHVLLDTERSTLDLDRSEVLDLVRRLTSTADDHDDVLVARFGGRLGSCTLSEPKVASQDIAARADLRRARSRSACSGTSSARPLHAARAPANRSSWRPTTRTTNSTGPDDG